MLRTLTGPPHIAQVLSFARALVRSPMLYRAHCQSFVQKRLLTAEPLSSSILRQESLESLLKRPSRSENLKQLLNLLGEEPVTAVCEDVSVLDLRIVRPLSETVKLSPAAIYNLLELALAPSLQSFYGRSSVTPQTRLDLLSPDFILRSLIHPLSRFGVGDPVRAINRCPALFAAAIMREEGEDSRLDAALKALSMLLSRKDLATLIKKCPGSFMLLFSATDMYVVVYVYIHSTCRSVDKVSR
uniref:Uncharacterized protein n=1 Tax=Schistocephalus solidus TaxID=70667 RepID=A0A0X3NHS4_SCHSO